MEGGGGGPTTTSSSLSRPVRSSSRFYYNNNNGNNNGNHSTSSPASFSGPVRRWEKKWVHVSSSLPSTKKHRKQSNAPKSSSLLLCKWTPLSADNTSAAELPRRKFRYTPIALFQDEKKLSSKQVVDDDKLEEMHQPGTRIAMESDDIYGMVDINEEASKSRRSHLNLGLYSENQNNDSRLDMVNLGGF